MFKKFNIQQKAKYMINKGKVIFQGSTDQNEYYKISQILITYDKYNDTYKCTCKDCSLPNDKKPRCCFVRAVKLWKIK